MALTFSIAGCGKQPLADNASTPSNAPVEANISYSANHAATIAAHIATQVNNDDEVNTNDILRDNDVQAHEFLSENDESPVSSVEATNTSSESLGNNSVDNADNNAKDVTNDDVAQCKFSLSAFESELINLINEYRASQGLSPLVVDGELCVLASVRAREASQLWSHTRPNNKRASSVFDEYHVEKRVCTGENLAKHSSQNAALIVRAWIESEGHRANLLCNYFKTTGIAVYEYNGKYYIANIFNG